MSLNARHHFPEDTTHLEGRFFETPEGQRVAFLFESEQPNSPPLITYQEMWGDMRRISVKKNVFFGSVTREKDDTVIPRFQLVTAET